MSVHQHLHAARDMLFDGALCDLQAIGDLALGQSMDLPQHKHLTAFFGK